MHTPPLIAPSSSGSAGINGILSSSGPSTPTSARQQDVIHRLYHAFDSDDDNDEDTLSPLFMRRTPKQFLKKPVTPSKKGGRTQSSPSRFMIKGTVTPSRAAPLFARFTKDRRIAHRKQRKSGEWSDSDEENSSTTFWTPTKSTPSPRKQNINRTPLSSLRQPNSPIEISRSPFPLSNRNQSTFINPSFRNAKPPLMPIPIPLLQRPGMISTNIASYMHAMKSNNLGHLAYATSSRGNTISHSGRGGVLSVVSRLGGGGSGKPCDFSQRSFHSTFTTTSTPSTDLFTLPAENDSINLSHPICAEYANSSRCLTGQQAQWLAIGNNEGRLFLLNTLEGAMSEQDGSTPSWQAHDGSIFEVKWRPDDEMIATGGSDYQIRVWNTSTGEQIRSFQGHRGTPRSIAWDPNGNENILASGGRDGAIHLFDLRVPDREKEGDEDSLSDPMPLVTLWGAHTYEPIRPLKGPGSRGGRRGMNGRSTYPKGVTSLTYVPSRGPNILCSAGCGDGIVKLWDLRQMASYDEFDVNTHYNEDVDVIERKPMEESSDIGMQFRRNKSLHGISSIVASSQKVFAACTDGCIYSLPLYDLKAQCTSNLGLPMAPLYDPVQRGNTLFARLALHDDERTLALGCNSGTITVWDTHAAGTAAAELSSLGVDLTVLRTANTGKNLPSSSQSYSEDLLDTYNGKASQLSIYAQGQEDLIEMAKPAILRGGHQTYLEINGISWAHGLNGPTLASISDDHTIRTWSAKAQDQEQDEDIILN